MLSISVFFLDLPIDVTLLNEFLSWKKLLDNTRTLYLSTSSVEKSPFEGQEETEITRAAGDASNKMMVYENYMKLIAKGTADEAKRQRGRKNSESGFTKFLKTFPPKLTPILDKAGIKMVILY